MEKKLKPVTFTTGKYLFNRDNDLQQRLLLKAVTITQDPAKLQQMIGAKTIADVYRTFDKLALRKEYQDALARNNISFDYIVQGIKLIADTGEKDGDKLKALQGLLKSLGLDAYKDAPPASGNWEEFLTNLPKGELKELKETEDYDVVFPEIPESAKKMREEEEEVGKSLYE